MSDFDFSMIYTKISHRKVLYVLSDITEFACSGGTKDYVTVYNSGVFWSHSKSKTGTYNSFQEIKPCLEFLISDSFSQVGSKIFCHVIGIAIGSDRVPFSANFFLFCAPKWLKSIKILTMRLQYLAIFLDLLMI